MKKYLACILIIVIFGCALSGCDVSNNNQSSPDAMFVKPEKYAAIVNVQINPSFDIYLDKKAVILGIEPKNEDAKAIDFSRYIGLELTSTIDDLVGVVCKGVSLNRESVALVKFIEGEQNILEIDVVEIINYAFADAVAESIVNESMESVLQVRLEDEFGCQCMECNNWYERHWYPYIESKHVDMHKEYDQYMESWKKSLETLDKNDPLYDSYWESYNNMTYEDFDFKEIKCRQFYLTFEETYGRIQHEEKIITYKILDSVSNKSGSHVKKTEEFTAEEYFKKNPDQREKLQGLEKVICVEVEVYVNGEREGDYYSGRLYQCDGKWYSNNGLRWSFG